MKKTYNFLAKLSLIAILGAIIFTPTIHIANAQSTNLNYFLESDSGAVSPGDTFNLEIKISNPSSEEVRAVGAKITFDSTVLEVVDADSGTTGTQINTSTSFPTVVENVVTAGVIMYTAGNTSGISTTTLLVATIPFRVKSPIISSGTQIVFDTGSDTSILGADGATELLSSTTPFDIVISGIGMSMTPSSQELSEGDQVTLTFLLSNPDAKEIVTTEMKVGYDTSIFDFIPSNSSQPTQIDMTSSDFTINVENEVSAGVIHVSTGIPGTTPLTTASIIVGSATFEVKSSAIDGTTDVEFITLDSLVYEKDNIISSLLTSFSNASFEIGDSTKPRVEADPDGGTFTDSVDVALEVTNMDEDDVEIYYTTDGSRPDLGDSDTRRYRSEITINEDTRLRFYAISDAGVESDDEDERYVITSNEPTPTPIPTPVTTNVGRVYIVKSELTTSMDNLIPVTVEDTSGSPVADGVYVTLNITSEGMSEIYSGYTSGGIATITAPGGDFERGKTYTLIAYAGNVTSDAVEITIPLALRPGPPISQPGSGPAENIAIAFLVISGAIALYLERRRVRVRR